MDPEAAEAYLRARLEPLPPGLTLEIDEWGNLVLFVRRDLYHLDADALNDRLHAWVVREVHPVLPIADSHVEFRHARPANTEEPELDVQAAWRDLEPSFRLDLHHDPDEKALDTFLRLVPTFLEKVHGEGRPDNWRDPEMGAAE